MPTLLLLTLPEGRQVLSSALLAQLLLVPSSELLAGALRSAEPVLLATGVVLSEGRGEELKLAEGVGVPEGCDEAEPSPPALRPLPLVRLELDVALLSRVCSADAEELGVCAPIVIVPPPPLLAVPTTEPTGLPLP